MRFAPPALAERFAFERYRPNGQTFGFHGLFNFPDVLMPAELDSVLDALDPPLQGGPDGADLILRLLQTGNRKLAWRNWRRRLPYQSWTLRDLALPLRLLAAAIGLQVH